jgi:hypothetical protein
MRWGLIPYWAKDIKIGFSTINARAEEIDTKPAFREAFRQRRCLVPLDSFYEWKKIGTGKQTYAIRARRPSPDGHGRVMGNLAVAGGRENFAALPSSPPSRTNCAPSSTTACPWCWSRRPGRRGWANSRRACRSSKRCRRPTLPRK